jgi:hypothetical protein
LTRLHGDFQTDLLPPDALSACAEAIDGLGWRIETVDARRIVSYAASGPVQEAPRIEVLLSESDGTTDVRIVGSDSEVQPLPQEQLIAELDRARMAIQASIENAGEGAGHGSALDRVVMFDQRPRAHQIISAVVVPAVFGAIVGVTLGISAGLYWALQLVGFIGAILAGLEHRNGREGALRGLVGGTLFGTFLLLAHAASGSDETVKLPDFQPALVVFTVLGGVIGSGLGGRLRRRATERQAGSTSIPA